MRLQYKAVSQEGKALSGVIEAKDVKEAVAYLRERDFVPITISPIKNVLFPFLSFMNAPKASEVVFFTRQLASMFLSGLTLMQALRILRDQVQNQTMKDMINDIISDIEEGKSFSDALKKHPQVFSSIYIALVKAAEASGLLDKILTRLADNLEKEQRLKGALKSALIYPTIVIIGMGVVMAIMMVVVIPQLSKLYKDLNVELPLPTQIVVGLSNFIVSFWPLIIGAFILTTVAYNRWNKTETGKLIMDSLKLKLPVFGQLLRESILTEFTRTLGLLVGSGTLVVDALNQTANVAGNILYKNAIMGIANRVEKGVSIGDAMLSYNLFPAIITHMAKIGEETGKLDESMGKVSEYYEREVDMKIKNLTTAMEPIIMIVLGVSVVFLIISIITPIYKLTSALG